MAADVELFVTPSYILRSVTWTDGPLRYDAEQRVLTYRRPRVLADQTVQLVFPAVQEGYAVSVELVEGQRYGDIEVRDDKIYFPPVAMFRELGAEVTFDPTANALAPLLPRQTVRFTVRIQPSEE
ncbi:MAG TPA: hypothetical protein VIK91_18725 [Nannocystis sp.]